MEGDEAPRHEYFRARKVSRVTRLRSAASRRLAGWLEGRLVGALGGRGSEQGDKRHRDAGITWFPCMNSVFTFAGRKLGRVVLL